MIKEKEKMEHLKLISYLIRLALVALLIGIGMKTGCFAQLTSFETREPQNEESTIDFDEDATNN